MQVVIKKGEAVKIGFLGTDGVITVTYGKQRLKVHADMPDSSGREKVIYEEIFAERVSGGRTPAGEVKTGLPGVDPDDDPSDSE